MKRKTFKVFSMLISLAIIASLASGCTTRQTQESTTQAATTTTAAVIETTSETTTETKKEDKPVIVTLYDSESVKLDQFNEMLKEFNVKYPDITIDPQHNGSNYEVLLKTKINSGQIPDVFMTYGSADQNKLYGEYCYDFSNEPLAKRFFDDAIQQCTYEGKIIGLPWNYNSISVIYNNKLFNDAGISEAPKTLPELEKVCEQLKAKGITPFSNGYKETWVLGHIASQFLACEGKTEDLVKGLNDGTKKFSDLKFMNNLFNFLDLTIKYGLPKSLEKGWEEEETDLALGKAAIIAMGDWAEPVFLKANPDVKVTLFLLPTSDDPSTALIMSNVSWIYRVNKDTKVYDAAIKYLDFFFTSEKGQWLNVTVGNAISSVKNGIKPTGMLAMQAMDFIAQGKSKPWPHMFWSTDLQQKLGEIMQAYVGKMATREQALNQLTEAWAKTKATQ